MRMCGCVLYDILAGHPIRSELEGFGKSTSEGDDIWACQVFPLCPFLAKVPPSVSSASKNRKRLWRQ